jgi:hypothetical protein
MMEEVVENIRDHLEAHSRISLTTSRQSLHTGVRRSTCHKIVKGELAFTSIQNNNCTRAPPY